MIRLDKYLCEAEAGSRSQVKALIKKGRVTVNGEPAREPERKVDEERDRVELDGEPVCYERFVYYMLHKPAGLVTATQDKRERTVMELLKEAPGRGLFPVGRLDKDTEGLLLITNDGALAHRLLSPARHVDKTYLVKTALPVTEQMYEALRAGVEIGDDKPTRPAAADPLPGTECGLILTITEGRFHQVKRMLQAVGNEVLYLKRLSMGPLVLDETLEKGAFRPLREKELEALGRTDQGKADRGGAT
ncbi:MAG: pseudouridine synthase [Eubacteriales bacterium]|nr:pseudouridine synthase [Eubacteriales bacterium]